MMKQVFLSVLEFNNNVDKVILPTMELPTDLS